MRPVRTAHPTRVGPQNGYILLPVVLLITLISVVAFLLNHESALGTGITGSNAEADRAEYIARAGMAHATWGGQNSGCAGDMGMTTVPFGQAGTDSYTATVTSPGGSTTAYSLSADQDAWFRSDDPTVNNGTTADMHLRMESGKLEYALYRFDLSSLPAGSQINSASAWLYVTNSGPGGGAFPEGPLTVHRVTSDWTETGATWDTMSTNYDSAVIATVPAQSQDAVWVQVNLTTQVQAWSNGGDPNFGIMLRPNGEGTHGKLVSREGVAAEQPRLDVIVGTGAASPVTITATGTLTGNPTPANDIMRSLTRTTVPAYQPPGYSFLQLQPGSGKDAMLSGFYNSRNYGDYRLRVTSSPGSHRNSLVQFNLAAIPVGAKVISAQLQLYHTVTETPGTDAGVTVHRVSRDWLEGTHSGSGSADGATWDTWDGTNAWTTAGGDYDPAPVANSPITDATGDWESWDISTLVQGWLDGSFANNGLLLKGSGTVAVSFGSKEDADPTLHPRLSITYACVCGSPCLAPQGSGALLMVVVNPTTLVPKDAYKKALFESWGYTVAVISESENQAGYDSAVAAAAVVFISETVNANQVGTKLKDVTIGVVSQDGSYNSALGFSTGSVWSVGAAINVTDTSHYITTPFPAGPLNIYSAAMEQLTVSGSEAPGLQTLADSGGAGSLVVLDKGAMGTGGVPIPGRRVMLPLGRDANFNWDYLNSSGRLLVQRALQWGMGNTSGGGLRVLYVVKDPAVLSTQEAARQALMEGWGFIVSLIDDDDTQANFDAVATANDVAYISQEALATSLGTTLVNTSIGVVNENKDLIDEFGFASSANLAGGMPAINVDTSHYITSVFTANPVVAYGVNDWYQIASTPVAAGVQPAGVWVDAPWTDLPALLTLSPGADLIGGGTAAGHRVQIPMGAGQGGVPVDINGLTDDGRTIIKRSIEWAGGVGSLAGPLAHWKLDETSGTTAVDSEGGHHGTLTNSPIWDNGIIDGALAFDGFDDYVDLTSDADLDDVFVGGATVMAWVYAESWGGNNYGRILDKSSELGGDRDGWMIGLYGDNQAVSLAQGFTGGRGFWRPQNGTFPLNEWVHVAFVYDSSSDANDPVIYLNGVAQSSLVEISPSGTIRSDASISLRMGNHAQDTSRSFDGKLDDVRIYDRMLSDTEIAELATGGGSAQTVLMVVGDASTPASTDAERKALVESWGHAVTLIDDSDSQANFDTAVAAADVAYVSESVIAGTLAKKLKPITIGVVNEDPGLHNVFGFSSNRYLSTDNSSLTTDAGHYITAPFGGATVLALFTSSQPLGAAVGTLPSGLETIGSWSGGSLSPLGGLLVLDSGAAISGGGSAAGRRVQLPWGGEDGVSVADITALTPDGQTILQRSIEWAAAAGGGSGGGSGTPTGVVFAEFTDASLASNGKALTLSKPGGTAAGDLLIAAIATDGNQQTWNPPSTGWNLINQGNQSDEVSLAVWWKLAGSSEPAGYNFSWAEDQEAYAWMMRFTGHDPANPINVSSNVGGSSSSPSSPAVTTSVADTMILRIGGFDDDDVSVGVPGLSGHTAITMGNSDTGNGTCSGGAGYLIQSTAGSSGTSTFSLTRSEQYRAVTIGIAPAP